LWQHQNGFARQARWRERAFDHEQQKSGNLHQQRQGDTDAALR
jgi:hypothetical protein